MSHAVRRWVVLSVTVLSLLGSGAFAGAQEQPQPPQQQLAKVQELKAEAINAVLQGKFSQTNDLLNRAAASTQDPLVARMAGWINQFEKQRTDFTAERHQQYETAVGEGAKLIENKFESYAIDAAARAYLLADDKVKFRA